MPFAPKTHASLFPASRRRPSFAPDEQSEVLSSDYSPHSTFPGMQPSASTSWINPFGRPSFSIDDDRDAYVAPSSPPSSRRPSAATIISTLLHKSVGQNSNASCSTVRLDDSSDELPASVGRRPSAIFKAWKARRGSSSAQPQVPPPSSMGYAQGRRKSSALTRVLQPSNLRNGAGRVDEHSLSSGDTASGRRRSLSIVCRGERDSIELPEEGVREGEVTAAMAIRDTWLVSERKGSVSTLATSPSSSFAPRKSISAMGLDTEDQLSQHLSLQERLRQIREKRLPEEADDTESVVSLSLTEEIALYTTDVQTVEANAGRARRSVGNAEMAGSPFVWNLPDWGNGRLERLPELSPAPELVIADPFARSRRGTAISMQRGESGMLDPVLSPVPAYSPTVISSEDASLGHGEGVQWSTASPFGAPRPSLAQTSSWYSAEDHSPTSPGFPPASPLPPSPVSPLPVESLRSRTAEMRASLRPTSTARSPHSPRSFGISETSYEMRATSRLSYSHPRPPVDYESENGSQYSATPRLVGADWGGSPMSSLFECQTPHQAMFDVTEAKEEDGEDLHEQFCSVLLLDLGDGRTVGLGGERGLMAC